MLKLAIRRHCRNGLVLVRGTTRRRATLNPKGGPPKTDFCNIHFWLGAQCLSESGQPQWPATPCFGGQACQPSASICGATAMRSTSWSQREESACGCGFSRPHFCQLDFLFSQQLKDMLPLPKYAFLGWSGAALREESGWFKGVPGLFVDTWACFLPLDVVPLPTCPLEARRLVENCGKLPLRSFC